MRSLASLCKRAKPVKEITFTLLIFRPLIVLLGKKTTTTTTKKKSIVSIKVLC